MRNLKEIEYIFNGRKKIATIIRNQFSPNNLEFLTSEIEPLQVATHHYSSKKIGRVHGPHKKKSVIITKMHKFLYIKSGKVKVTFFNSKHKVISSKILKSGDSIVVTNIAHKFDFFPNSRAIEIKQGPYEI